MLPFLLLPFLLSSVSASNVTCAKTSPQTEWYYNSQGLNPCQQFEDLYQICEPKFKMFSIQGGVFEYFCQPDNDVSDFCCCNSVSFALFSACKSCQWGTPPVASTSQTYGTWLGHCSRKAGITITNGSLPTNLTTEGLVFPPYSFINPTSPISSYKWNYSAAEANATAAKSFSAKAGGLSAGGKAGVAVSRV
ncbi:hypothetical protein BDY24DRAFT_400402 [Mrakia frigida]|uniref:uncharacterized protein n=1 Tax=Mrakia frigida TaxID=29902 RepID=UPI003FCC0DF2